MIKDAFPIKGELQIILRDILTGEVRVRNEKNLVVSVVEQADSDFFSP